MISSPLLSQLAGYVDGQWTRSDRTFRVINPATGEHLADLPGLGAIETGAAVEAAARMVGTGTSVDQRRQWLEGIDRALVQNKAELARIITMEQGKPLKESTVEVEYAAGFFRIMARHLEHLAPRELPEKVKNMSWAVYHRPAGVVAMITPWNFPLAMMAKKLSGAIGAGCGIVAKPAELTPLTAIAFWNLIEPLGMPRGMMNLVIGKAAPIGGVMCSHPLVRLISFTGSTEVGRKLIADSAPYVKRTAMELGGNAPYLVLDDADSEQAADALIPNKFRCAGQTCVCANRILVHRSQVKAFTDAIAARVRKLRMGNGLEDGIDLGPLINRDAFEKVDRHVTDAIDHGAKRVVGEDRPIPEETWGAFYPPTVLVGTRHEMMISQEETFGPVVAISEFDSEDEAVAMANGTPFGLAAYVFTRDRARAERVAARLQFGHVAVNTGQGPTPEAPFGGMKQSGFGREGGIEGLLEFCETQTVVVA